MLDRELPMSSRQIASFARMGHETVRRGADALTELGLMTATVGPDSKTV